MEKLYLSLRDAKPEIHLDEELCKSAILPLERMLLGRLDFPFEAV